MCDLLRGWRVCEKAATFGIVSGINVRSVPSQCTVCVCVCVFDAQFECVCVPLVCPDVKYCMLFVRHLETRRGRLYRIPAR